MLTFDYRYFGESGGKPRQVINPKKQLEDLRAAISLARSLDDVDPLRVSLWGSSLSGGHVVNLAAEDPAIAAVVAQTPAFDKSIRRISKEINAKKEREGISLASQILDYLRSLAAGTYDGFRGLLGLSPHYIPRFELSAAIEREADFMLGRLPEAFGLTPSITASASAYSSLGALHRRSRKG